MKKWLMAVFSAMLVLTSAMGLKGVTTHSTVAGATAALSGGDPRPPFPPPPPGAQIYSASPARPSVTR